MSVFRTISYDKNKGFVERIDRYFFVSDWKKKKRRRRTYKNVLSIGAASVWIINIIDAATSGKQRFASSNKFEIYNYKNQFGVKFNF